MSGLFFVSTNYLSTSMSQSIMQAQSELATAQTEEASGQYADLGVQLGPESGYELSLKNQNQLLQTLTTANGVVSTNLSATQNALTSLTTSAQSALQDLAGMSSGTNVDTAMQNLGESSLQSLISAANTNSNGQYVFGGINTGVAPLADYYSSPTSAAKTAIDQAFTAAFGVSPTDPGAASISASAMQNFLGSTFADQFQGAAWTSNWSLASSTNTTSDIAPGQTIQTSTNANQPGFQLLAQAYTMMSEFGGSSLSSAAQQVVATTATTLINQGLADLTSTSAEIGEAQASITDANNSMAAQSTMLQTQIGNLDDVNPYTTATQVNALTTQIETAYELTAQLSQLSLAKYLPVS